MVQSSVFELARPIFRRWERLRILYNALLLALFLCVYGLDPILAFSWPLLVTGLAGAVLANTCYFAGPAAESYVTWLGVRWRYTTVALFLAGALLSVPCVVLFPMFLFFGM